MGSSHKKAYGKMLYCFVATSHGSCTGCASPKTQRSQIAADGVLAEVPLLAAALEAEQSKNEVELERLLGCLRVCREYHASRTRAAEALFRGCMLLARGAEVDAAPIKVFVVALKGILADGAMDSAETEAALAGECKWSA